ncbi:Retrovirus-related Pol polyprotein from transposon TNT 1-94 [Dendrobium catenatum]|uniref:Retrovirus-related Pol polyprotein from transposon TNT 1-94 n=1 Tax=Dendrobium catenatum TaxID=906689 RepID=A0A2I0VST2_9ASPA|nr:Retrovirus-related Pol polyprotein from transposon TNT 1-94 [Dendrobium catenatum]
MKALLILQGTSEAISKVDLAVVIDRPRARQMQLKAHCAILLSLGNEVLREVAEEGSSIEVWEKMEFLYLKISLANRLYLKKDLYTLHMEEGKYLKKYIDEFNKFILDLKNVDVRIEEENQGVILLSSLLKSYENIKDTLLYGKQTLTMIEVKSILVSKQLQRRNEDKDKSVGDILVARGRHEKEGHFKINCPNLLKRKGVRPKDHAKIAETSNEYMDIL